MDDAEEMDPKEDGGCLAGEREEELLLDSAPQRRCLGPRNRMSGTCGFREIRAILEWDRNSDAYVAVCSSLN